MLWQVLLAFGGEEVPMTGTSTPLMPPESPSPETLPQECTLCHNKRWWRLKGRQGVPWVCEVCHPPGTDLPIEQAERW